MSDEIKVVINLKGDAATIGVQKPDCDPVFRTAEGDLGAVMTRAGELVTEANAIWDANPRYPKCETKLPSQETPPARTTTTRQTQTAPKKDQPVLF